MMAVITVGDNNIMSNIDWLVVIASAVGGKIRSFHEEPSMVQASFPLV